MFPRRFNLLLGDDEDKHEEKRENEYESDDRKKDVKDDLNIFVQVVEEK